TDVLIIDDDEQVCITLAKVFNRMGYATRYQQTLRDGLADIFSDTIAVVFLDVNLPDGNGLEAIKTIQQHPDSPEIIIITGNEDVDGAELAMRSKAWDYISKTGSYKKFKFALSRALEYRKQKQSVQSENTIKRKMIVNETRFIKSICNRLKFTGTYSIK
ncbi:MAG TPA: sigma-54-dependent Fis family transcriptional regulator, partial [Bacteroidales bacterium]|nr:sigma-54-dependent Fis family transcriptional regulator [Bacteroidales bacterium]